MLHSETSSALQTTWHHLHTGADIDSALVCHAVRGWCTTPSWHEATRRSSGSLTGFRQHGMADESTLSQSLTGSENPDTGSESQHRCVGGSCQSACSLMSMYFLDCSQHVPQTVGQDVVRPGPLELDYRGSRIGSSYQDWNLRRTCGARFSADGVDDQCRPVSGKSATLGFRLPSNFSRDPTCRAGPWAFHVDDVPDKTGFWQCTATVN